MKKVELSRVPGLGMDWVVFLNHVQLISKLNNILEQN